MRYDISNIGERIRHVQKQNEMSQADFADKIGFHLGTVNKWIRGINPPSLLGLAAICEVYDVKLTELVKPIKPKQNVMKVKR